MVLNNINTNTIDIYTYIHNQNKNNYNKVYDFLFVSIYYLKKNKMHTVVATAFPFTQTCKLSLAEKKLGLLYNGNITWSYDELNSLLLYALH